jgi:hypothetical protein
VLTVGREERNCGVVGTHSKKEGMAATGKGTLLSREPDGDRAGVSVAAGGGMPTDGQSMGATKATSDTARAGVAQVAREGAPQQRGGAQWAALMEQAEEAAARLKELMDKLGSMGVAPLAETEPQRVVLDVRLGPAAECLNTACEDLQAAATQLDPAREQLLRAEAHLSFAKLHMTAAQRLQTPAGEVGAQSGTPLIPAGAQLVRALTEAQGFEAEASALQASWMQAALRRTACVSYIALEACEVAVQISWKSQEYSAYHDLLDREERKLDEAFAGMRPGELPGRVVAAAEVSLDDAYDNITLAQACLAVRS